MTEPLALYAALELYDLLKPYLPEDLDDSQESVDFVLSIMNKMKTEQGADDFFDAISLMNVQESLPEKPMSLDYMNAMIDGLAINQVIYLADFSRKLGL